MARLIVIAFLVFTGCNSQEKTVNNVSTKKGDTTSPGSNITPSSMPLTGCYRWAVKRDTATMKLDVEGDKVTGNLRYDLYEKDRNVGMLTGVIKDDLIIADYIFQSEGMTSVREVVIKIKDKSLVEGFGEYDTSSDTLHFKNIGQLKFHNNRVFNKS